jgi:predicted anti-sigma-YlaC factor YlaD
MQCRELEVFFEREGLAPLSAAARQHLSECHACKHFFDDVSSIVALAHQLPAELEPPEHIWISIRNELVREGTIRGFSSNRAAAPWWQSFAELFRTRSLATAAVAMVMIVVAFLLGSKPREQVLQVQEDPYASTVTALSQQEHDLANMQLASTGETSAVDASLRQNLEQVNEFIADCERRVREVPSDELAREYLTNAYQQKAQLLSAMMDRGGSLN